MAPMRKACVLALALLVARPQPTLAELLSRAGGYVVDLEHRFATVISDERYEQHTVGGYQRVGARSLPAPARDREIESEMLFVWLERIRAWLAVRNVLTVDGQAVDGRERRLDRLLTGGGPIGLSHLRQWRDESTRFNIGSIHRNFNDPLTPLRFLEPQSQSGLFQTERVRNAGRAEPPGRFR